MGSIACMVVALLLATLNNAHAADPDIPADYVVPQPSADSFTHRGLQQSLRGPPQYGVPYRVTILNQVEFPALAGQSVSINALQFAPGSTMPPHTNSAGEILLVLQGCLEVGFVDTDNRLYAQVLEAGDAFVIPKGLVRFYANRDANRSAAALAAYGSANVGFVLFRSTLFGSGMDKEMLAKAFGVDAHTIEKLVSANTMG